jgi:hypothetical protein
LGRTFLQEAYLSVDNTKQSFTVSQRQWPYPAISEIVPGPIITHSLTPAIYAAIGVSCLVTLAILTIAVWFFIRRKRLRLAAKKRKEEEEEAARKAKEMEDNIIPDQFATPEGVIVRSIPRNGTHHY